MPNLPLPHSPLTVWSVEETAIQLCWGNLPRGEVTARALDHFASVDHQGGAGSLVLSGLPSGTSLDVAVSHRGGEAHLRATTTTPPPGELLARVATVSDLHIGAERWGFLKTMTEASIGLDIPDGAAFASAFNAISDASAWGASHLVIKGDMVHHRCAQSFSEVGRLVDFFGQMSMQLIPGNHDVDRHTDIELPATVGERRVPLTRHLGSLDLPGLRSIVVDTAIEGRGYGQIDHAKDELLQLVSESDTPAMISLHQQLQDHRFPTFWPPGISAPSSQNFLTDLAKTKKAVFVVSGHTHRNRAHARKGVRVFEVASTRDWPGVWAGYSIYSGGVSQIVRRISDPQVMAWHEYSKNAVAGLWRFWAPGKLSDRSVVFDWPN